MTGKTLVWLVMLGGLASAWYAATHPDLIRSSRNWAHARLTGSDPTYSERQFEQDIVDRMNFSRRNAKLPPIVVDPDLHDWLRASNHRIDTNNLDEVIRLVQAEQPRYFEVNVSAASAPRLQELAERFSAIVSQAHPHSHHMGVIVRKQEKNFGYEAVLVIGQRLENFSPEALSDRTSDTFFSRCPHCKTAHACKISLAQRGVNLDCPKCNLDYGVLAPDQDGRFRFVNEYLTGYQPPTRYAVESNRLHEMFTIWNAVVSSFEYTKDTHSTAPNRDCWQTAIETLVRAKGDCEDSSILLADWLLARGYDVRVALGRYGDMGQHAWCVVRIDNVDYLLESTEGPPNIEKLPFVSEIGSRYVPETLFDRENIYVRGKPQERFDGNYWSPKNWVKVRPRHLFDDPAVKAPVLADGATSQTVTSVPSAPRPITTGTRTKRNNDPAGVPTPPFQRLREVPSGSERWQLALPKPK